MALKTVIESVDGLDEAIAGLYKQNEDGDGYILDIEGVDDHPKVRGVVTANAENKRKRDKYKSELEALQARYEGLPEDFDADAFEALKTQADGKEPPKTDEQVARVREQLENKHKRDLEKIETERDRYKGLLNRATVDDGLSKALDEAGIDAKYKPAVRALLKDKGAIKLVDEDDRFDAVVETDMGAMPLSSYVKEWAASDEGKHYVEPPKGGNERGSSGQRNNEDNPFGKPSWNKTQQAMLIRTDKAKAERLATAAGFKSLDAANVARTPIEG